MRVFAIPRVTGVARVRCISRTKDVLVSSRLSLVAIFAEDVLYKLDEISRSNVTEMLPNRSAVQKE